MAPRIGSHTPEFNETDWDSSLAGSSASSSRFFTPDPIEIGPEIDPEPAETPTIEDGQLFGTFQEGIDTINGILGPTGYAVVKRRTKSNATDGLYIVVLRCDRGRRPDSSRAASPELPVANTALSRPSRQTFTSMTGCEYGLNLRLQRETGLWRLQVDHGEHNHEPGPQSTHPTLRRRALEPHLDTLDPLIRQGIPPRQIISLLASQGIHLRPADIYNRARRLLQELLAGRTPIQALFEELPKHGDWILRHTTQADGETVSGVFAIHRTGLAQLRQSPSVLWMDCTYQTNRFNMPLLDIIGVNSIGRSFCVGFAFLPSEREDAYRWALRCLQGIYDEYGLGKPLTVFTDKEKALLNALAVALPTTASLLCLWHVISNIKAKAIPAARKHVKALIDAGEVEKEAYIAYATAFWLKMLQRWNRVVFAETEQRMREQWLYFCSCYSEPVFSNLLTYIEKHWIIESGRQVLRCFTNSFFHLGETSTSRVEGAHAALKKDLQNSRRNLLALLHCFETVILRQFKLSQQAIADEKARSPTVLSAMRHPIVRDVLRLVSRKAIGRVLKLYHAHLPEDEGIPGKRPFAVGCTPGCKATGYPCIHDIKWADMIGVSVKLSQFHTQWHLYETEAPPIGLSHLLQEPEILTSIRGRPKGALNNLPTSTASSTQRDPSLEVEDEVEDEDEDVEAEDEDVEAHNSPGSSGYGPDVAGEQSYVAGVGNRIDYVAGGISGTGNSFVYGPGIVCKHSYVAGGISGTRNSFVYGPGRGPGSEYLVRPAQEASESSLNS
ncbi:hypothetical protein PENANT_c317G11027, partial [Penicillium antarcticum]